MVFKKLRAFCYLCFVSYCLVCSLQPVVTLLLVIFFLCFVTFPYGVLDQMWYSRNGLLFLLFVFSVILSCLFLTALWSLLGRGYPLGSLVCDVFWCFVTFPYGVLGQVWYLIVWIHDLCLLPYFVHLWCNTQNIYKNKGKM